MSYTEKSKNASSFGPETRRGAKGRVLLVDDEPDSALLSSTVLNHAGFECEIAPGAAAALSVLERSEKDVVVSDVSMPMMDGVELARRVRARWPELSVILLTAKAEVEIAAAATQGGVLGYAKVPFNPRDFTETVGRAVSMTLDARHDKRVCDAAREIGFISESPQISAILATVARVAPSKAAVLIEGERGTGRTMLAHLLHRWSYRAAAPLEEIDCAEFRSPARAAEFCARLERASGGTLLLREVGAAGADLQAALARMLEDGQMRTVCGEVREIDFRVVATTDRILRTEAAAGRFRADLLRDLAEVAIRIPPLRERPEAILPLARAFLAAQAGDGKAPAAITPEAERLMLFYEWPDNVRELRERVERAAVLSGGRPITAELTGIEAAEPSGHEESRSSRERKMNLDSAAAQRVKSALETAAGDEAAAAARLGVTLAAIHHLRRRFAI